MTVGRSTIVVMIPFVLLPGKKFDVDTINFVQKRNKTVQKHVSGHRVDPDDVRVK